MSFHTDIQYMYAIKYIYTHTSTELWYLYTKEKKRIKYNHISVIIDHKLNYAEYYINVITRRHKLLNNITPAIIFVWRSRDTSHLCLGCEVCYFHFFNEEQKAHGEASLSNYASCISTNSLWLHTCEPAILLPLMSNVLKCTLHSEQGVL